MVQLATLVVYFGWYLSLVLASICLGAAAQAAYLRLLKRFPFISLMSMEFLSSTVLLVVSQGLWTRHFWNSWHSMEYILGFFLVMVWLVPFVLFLGLSANETVLPGGLGGMPHAYSVSSLHSYGTDTAAHRQGTLQRRRGRGTKSLLLQIFNLVRRKRDEVLPEVEQTLSTMAGAKVHRI
ncbi:hypothetical protein WJX72_010579 [[Myrmecia] bisecta]|uniref:Protein TEX261 n=1 Tax=[Myrmecia] bisecta TaxID=41462 RepID=A0AAW1QGF3_9CHLO